MKKKKKGFSNDKHFTKIYLNNNTNSLEKRKKEFTKIKSLKSIQIPINKTINNRIHLYNISKINCSSKSLLFHRNKNSIDHSRNNNQTKTSVFKNYSNSTINKTENSESKLITSYSNILKPKSNVTNCKLKKNIKKKVNINTFFKNYKSGKFTLSFVSTLIKKE